MSEPMFYIQCLKHYAFDYILWWATDSSGYTYNLDNAQMYTEAEALSRCREGVDRMWPADLVQRHTEKAVSMVTLRCEQERENELVALLAKARDYVMTDDEREAQRRSFAYGNVNIENGDVTHADIDAAAERLRS